ncbi:MAG TPA: ABC transporter permease [Chloroflexota bacterium]|jgi:NitT/TauT family transport system permease protein|nr:ABC transporter permease [Chloroflexota bacterium]
MSAADVLPAPALEPADPAETVAGARARRRGVFGGFNIVTWRLIALVIFVLLWHLASIPAGKLLLPSPFDVIPAFWELLRSGQLLTATLSSLTVFLAGYALAIIVGVALGVLMGGMPRLGETLEIYVNALNSTPRVAFIPFIILWFGLGPTAKIVVVFFQAVMPVLINTYAGVQNTDPDLLEAARSFGARRGQMFRYVMLPGALPYIVTGLRLGAANALVGTVIAELYTALSGLGYLIAQFGGTFQTAKYFGPVLVLAAIGMVISQSLKVLERRLARWKSTQTQL